MRVTGARPPYADSVWNPAGGAVEQLESTVVPEMPESDTQVRGSP